jgi:hypothetical protein
LARRSQEQRAFFQLHLLQFHALRDGAGGLQAGGDQNVTRFTRRQKGSHYAGQVLDVVQNEQPAGLPFEPAADRLGHHVGVPFVFLGQVQQARNRAEAGDQRVAGIGAAPERSPVLVPMAVGVLDGGLRLADSTQPADGPRLRQRRRAAVGKGALQSLEVLFPAGEERAARREVPVAVAIIGLAFLRRQGRLSYARLAREEEAETLVAGIDPKVLVSPDRQRNMRAVGLREQNRDEFLVDPAGLVQDLANDPCLPGGAQALPGLFLTIEPPLVGSGADYQHKLGGLDLPLPPQFPALRRKALVLIQHRVDAVRAQAVRQLQHLRLVLG